MLWQHVWKLSNKYPRDWKQKKPVMRKVGAGEEMDFKVTKSLQRKQVEVAGHKYLNSMPCLRILTWACLQCPSWTNSSHLAHLAHLLFYKQWLKSSGSVLTRDKISIMYRSMLQLLSPVIPIIPNIMTVILHDFLCSVTFNANTSNKHLESRTFTFYL